MCSARRRVYHQHPSQEKICELIYRSRLEASLDYDGIFSFTSYVAPVVKFDSFDGSENELLNIYIYIYIHALLTCIFLNIYIYVNVIYPDA